MSAPGGYGKTILAAQLAASGRFQVTLWADANGQRLSRKQLLQTLLGSLGALTDGRVEQNVLLPEVTVASLEKELQDALGQYWGKSVCLVVDDLGPGVESSGMFELHDLLDRAVGAESCVVVTSRSASHVLDNRADAWLLEADDLRLSEDEAASIAESCGDGERAGEHAHLLRTCSGHAALFAVLVRHVRLRGSVSQSPQAPILHLSQHLRYLARAQLDEGEQTLLGVAALMGHGTLGDLESVLEQPIAEEQLRRIAECVPLVHVGPDERGMLEFRVHDLGRAAFRDESVGLGDQFGDLADRLLNRLAAKEEYGVVFELLAALHDAVDVPLWLERCGGEMLNRGGVSLVQRAFEAVPIAVLVQRPALLQLQARLAGNCGHVHEAISKSRLAAELAEYAQDTPTRLQARLLLGRMLIFVGNPIEAKATLETVLSEPSMNEDHEARLLLVATLAVASAQAGDIDAADHYCEMIEKAETLVAARAAARYYGDLARTYGYCALRGWYGKGVSLFSRRLLVDSPLEMRIPAMGNAATAFCFIGMLKRARSLVDEVLDLGESSGVQTWRPAFLGSRAAIAAGEGDYDSAEQDMEEIVSSAGAGQEFDLHCDLVYRSVWRRAAGDLEGALADSEQARGFFQSMRMVPVGWLAEVESCANLLALGDQAVALGRSAELLDARIPAGADIYRLAARLVMAEALRLEGSMQASTDCISESAGRIASGDGNWLVALYVRAFPGLLGIVAAAVGVNRLPSRLLRMLLRENEGRALSLARDALPEDSWRDLSRRLSRNDGAETEDAGTARAACRVRLFGGLEVVINGERIADPAWRKRKARLLFAMLVVRKGRDVPREQLLEYLWPEMDAERAVANFYVIWNNMKAALCPGLPKGQPLPYARTAGGVCRMDDLLVTSDLDEFERSLSEARRAETAGDREQQLAAYRRLAEIYRGDLLPGDIYDDWFAPLRERCRQEFGDAMLRAGRTLADDGDHIAALQMIRAALAHDAWREDLYQVALRCQIAAGQRSAAIETYMACRHKLSEDLGIDPSAETRRLYDQILAMEGPAEEGYTA
jgi:DNA-binding SARP family transcriptional activator/ATP/maltotriose-dependent transcriptional regulator MalT